MDLSVCRTAEKVGDWLVGWNTYLSLGDWLIPGGTAVTVKDPLRKCIDSNQDSQFIILSSDLETYH